MHLSTVDDAGRGSAAVRVLSGDVASSVDLLSRSPFRMRAPCLSEFGFDLPFPHAMNL